MCVFYMWDLKTIASKNIYYCNSASLILLCNISNQDACHLLIKLLRVAIRDSILFWNRSIFIPNYCCIATVIEALAATH